MGKNITKDIRRTWKRKNENMDTPIPDYGFSKDGQPDVYVYRSGGYRGSVRYKEGNENTDNKLQIAVFSNKNINQITNLIEFSSMSENTFAYGQKTIIGNAMIADIYQNSTLNVGRLYRKDELYLRDVNIEEDRDCIIKALLEYIFGSEYTEILDNPIEFPKPKPNTKRTKILL